MTRTYLTIVEKTNRYFRSNFILHNGLQWYHAGTNEETHMKELLEFFECEILLEKETKNSENGKIKFYNVSKDIISKCGGGFWNEDQLKEKINGRRYKSFLGLSNGSIVTCYAVFNDNENTVEILRPNPNAKEVYQKMSLEQDLEYRKNHWFL